jgi:hypothetical protein
MSDPLSRTRYRIGQRWAYRTTQQNVEKSLLIIGVEEHPKLGIYCKISIRYDPPRPSNPNGHVTHTEFNSTREALDQSVFELLDANCRLPYEVQGDQEFAITKEKWATINLDRVFVFIQSVDECLIWSEQQRRNQETERLNEEEDESRQMDRAIEDGDLDCARRLIDKDPDLIHLPLGGDESCSVDKLLNYAAWQGKLDIAKLFIDRGANLNWHGNNGFTPLHYAASHQHPEVAQLLIKAGADIEAQDDSGFTPVFRAVRTGEIGYGSVARVLEDHGALIDLNTAICFRRMQWVREYLLTHPNAVREAKFPAYLLEDMVIAIQCQIWSESTEFPPNSAIVAKVIAEAFPIMEMLIQQGANPNIGSALHTAVQLEDPAIADLLLRSGADPNRDLQKKTFLPSVAKTDAMRKILKQYGAQEDPRGPRDWIQELMDDLHREKK